MGVERPKQYLALGDQSVLERTLSRLAELRQLSGIMVGIAENDTWWPRQTLPSTPDVWACPGGSERAHTVVNALSALIGRGARDADLVLVHDAVRPCVNISDVERLIASCWSSASGGLLGCRLADTLKRVVSNERVNQTIPRDDLWRAMTPQLFPIGALGAALDQVLDSGGIVTDESEAMEQSGHEPLMIDSDPRNIKITRPADLELVAGYLGIDMGKGAFS